MEGMCTYNVYIFRNTWWGGRRAKSKIGGYVGAKLRGQRASKTPPEKEPLINTLHVHEHVYQLVETAQCTEYSSLRRWLYGLVKEGRGSSQFQYLDLQYELLQRCPQHLRQLIVSQLDHLMLSEQVETLTRLYPRYGMEALHVHRDYHLLLY